MGAVAIARFDAYRELSYRACWPPARLDGDPRQSDQRGRDHVCRD